MKLVTFHSVSGDCKVTIEEVGRFGVEKLEVFCEEHGRLGTVGPDDFAKYRLALHRAEDIGAEHMGLDKASWAVL